MILKNCEVEIIQKQSAHYFVMCDKTKLIESKNVSLNTIGGEIEELTDSMKEFLSSLNINISTYFTGEISWPIIGVTITYPNNFKLEFAHNYHQIILGTEGIFIKNGKIYLITQEDYQGFTIINLTDRTKQTFIPTTAKMGAGLCITEITNITVDDVITISVYGCIWGAPIEKYDIIIADPDNIPEADYICFGYAEEDDDWDDDDD